jgi:hypothetical protein
MPSITLTVNRYEFKTTINLRTGVINRVVDPDLEVAPTGRLAEFVFSVSVDGLPLGEIEDNEPDALRRHVQTRLATLKPDLVKQFEEEFHRITARHLGEGGWIVDRVDIELGSVKIAAALMLGFGLFVNFDSNKS